ncbi:MAG: DUF6786 family protein [Cyclobacteriaceae bacterium]
MKFILYLIFFFSLLAACRPASDDRNSATPAQVRDIAGSFAYDIEFLDKYLDDMIVLWDKDSSAGIIIAPEYQGRVMSSTSGGGEGFSYGWINYDLIASGETREHINPYGGEDRFWLGPEGGQYAIFFDEGEEFTFENWQTPAALDTEPFSLVSSSEREVSFSKKMQLTNYSGFRFSLSVDRTISLLDRQAAADLLQADIPDDINMVAFASENSITNEGEQAWENESGLLSIWILGMFRHSPATTVVIPYRQEAAEDVPVVNADYFGTVPEERLKVENGFIFFKGDGAYRSKIGVGPERALPEMGSYDAEREVLTIVSFSLPEEAEDYVNSMWELQDHPYEGDVINSYNDGPLEGEEAQLGPFYELESSSPAAALSPGESLSHSHTTLHFSGEPATLNKLSREILGIGINEIKAVFNE